MRQCTKFNSFYKKESDTDRAEVYINLKKKGCPSKKAINFCSKTICRTDITKKKDGPAGYNILKILPQNSYNLNGWSPSSPRYETEPNGEQIKSVFENNDNVQEAQLQKHFIMNEDKIRENFRKDITNLQRYYENINKKYQFTQLPKMSLYKKLQENREKEKEERQKKRHYFELNHIRFYNLGEEAYENSLKPDLQNNLVQKLNLFKLVGDSETKALDLKEETSSSSEGEEEDEEDDKMNGLPYIKKKNTTKLLKTFLKRGEKTDKNAVFRRPAFFQHLNNDMNRIDKKSMVFKTLEVQTSFLDNISRMENFISENSTSLSPVHARLLNPQRSSISRLNKNTPNSPSRQSISLQHLNTLNFDSKKFIEEQFNKSKYLTVGTPIKENKKRLSLINSAEIRAKMFRSSIKSTRGSTFLSNLNDIYDEDFNNTLTSIIKRNIDFQNCSPKIKKDLKIDMTCVNSMKMNRNLYKKRFQRLSISKTKTNKTTDSCI